MKKLLLISITFLSKYKLIASNNLIFSLLTISFQVKYDNSENKILSISLKETSSKDKFHINVYGTRKSDGKHIVLTKDHIYPRSMGGLDIMENYQTLCASCNCNKNNEAEISVEEAIEKGLTTQEIQDKLIELNAARDEFNKAQERLTKIKAEYQQLMPKRDKKEFI